VREIGPVLFFLIYFQFLASVGLYYTHTCLMGQRNSTLRGHSDWRKGKLKLSLCFNWAPRHEGVLEDWRYSSTHSLTSAVDRGEWSVHAPAALPQGKSPWCPLDRKVGGSQSRSGRGGKGKNFQPPLGIETQNPDRPARSLALYHWAVTAPFWLAFCL
jgi:hypothetical protein